MEYRDDENKIMTNSNPIPSPTQSRIHHPATHDRPSQTTTNGVIATRKLKRGEVSLRR